MGKQVNGEVTQDQRRVIAAFGRAVLYHGVDGGWQRAVVTGLDETGAAIVEDIDRAGARLELTTHHEFEDLIFIEPGAGAAHAGGESVAGLVGNGVTWPGGRGVVVGVDREFQGAWVERLEEGFSGEQGRSQVVGVPLCELTVELEPDELIADLGEQIDEAVQAR